MKSKSTHPVLLVHPDHEEAEYLRTRLTREGVSQTIVVYSETVGARDYLSAVMIAQPDEHRFRPCVVLLDEKVGEDDVRSFTQWLRAQPALESIHVVALTSNELPRRRDGTGVDDTVATNGKLYALTGVISRACE